MHDEHLSIIIIRQSQQAGKFGGIGLDVSHVDHNG
jgi:hypothetical protein